MDEITRRLFALMFPDWQARRRAAYSLAEIGTEVSHGQKGRIIDALMAAWECEKRTKVQQAIWEALQTIDVLFAEIRDRRSRRRTIRELLSGERRRIDLRRGVRGPTERRVRMIPTI